LIDQQEDIHKLFHEYVQINPGQLQKGQGSGLGLSICQSIVQLHGGGVWAESEGKGHGSTFNVVLPLYRRTTPLSPPNSFAEQISTSDRPSCRSPQSSFVISSMSSFRYSPRPHFFTRRGSEFTSDMTQSSDKFSVPNTNDVVSTGDEREARPIILPLPFPLSTMKEPLPLRFLVVDDSSANRRMLHRLLERDGQECFEADDGVTAVEAIDRMMRVSRGEAVDVATNSALAVAGKSHGASTLTYTGQEPIDVILMDFLMVNMNGPDAARAIRELGFRGPIIGVTGLMDEECDEFVKNGANVVMSKPVAVPNLWKALQSIDYL
jgi:CheY-like chemotaxis protein